MSAWLKEIDLDTFRVTVTPLTEDRALPGGVRLTRDGVLHTRDAGPRALEHGDDFTTHLALYVFLTRPMHDDAALLANLDARPDDDTAIKVWADWLLERGDLLGEHLLGPAPQQWVLEGLARPSLELTWNHGLVSSAKLRSTPTSGSPVNTLLRLRATRVFRWVRELTIDCATWAASVDDVQQLTARVLRVLLEGPALPALRRLQFGVNPEPFASTELLSRLASRLRAHFPALETDAVVLLRPTPAPMLEIVHVPEGLDFYAPDSRDRRLALTHGAWAGSASPGQLRLLTQGVHRGGVVESFLIERERLSLFPVDAVRLNGRPAFETRLLDGDVLEEPRGAVFRFRAG